MKITEVAKVVPGPNPHHVDARKIYESPHAMAVVITLKPGESLKRHMTPVDEREQGNLPCPRGEGAEADGGDEAAVIPGTLFLFSAGSLPIEKPHPLAGAILP
jgi:hypothetical protein